MNKLIGTIIFFLLLAGIFMYFVCIDSNFDDSLPTSTAISKKYIFDVKKVELSTDTSSSNLKIKLGLSTLMVPLEQLFRNDIEKKIFYDKWDINPSEQKISTPTNCNYLVIGIEYSNNNIGKINSLECLQYL